MEFSKHFIPARLKPFRREFRDRPFALLDLGIGDHSPSITKHWFPRCTYHGVDRRPLPDDHPDRAFIDEFTVMDLDTADLKELPDDHFDVIVASHVIEHLLNGLSLLERVARKLKPGGKIYVEFPSLRSLSLPRDRGILHFSDDPTHVRLYDIKEVVNTLLGNGITILRAGRRRERMRLLFAPLFVTAYAVRRVLGKSPRSWYLWDLLGFADFVLGEKTTRSHEDSPT